ncbi:hypothetical protein [Bradyrhizobium sp. UFLA05-109]
MTTHARSREAAPPAVVDVWKLDHAEHNGSDKGYCEVRSHNAQSADERHKGAPLFARLCAQLRTLTASLSAKKPALLSLARRARRLAWLKKRKIKALKSL